MPSDDADDITDLLVEWSQGNQRALDELMPLVYGELRKTARHHLARESTGHTLQTTDVINEVYLRLAGWRKTQWLNRTQFFGFAGGLMRQILVDHARAQQTSKRGGRATRVAVSKAFNIGGRQDIDFETILSLDAALSRLKTRDSQLCKLVELRFFAGLTVKETAKVLDVSKATLMRKWDLAKRWLARELGKQ